MFKRKKKIYTKNIIHFKDTTILKDIIDFLNGWKLQVYSEGCQDLDKIPNIEIIKKEIEI